MSTHDGIHTLADQVLRDVEQARIDSDARLKALNEQCDKLLAVIDAVQAGARALNAKCDNTALLKINVAHAGASTSSAPLTGARQSG